MVKDAMVDSAGGAGCHCRVPHAQRWVYFLSFPNFNELSYRDPDPPISQCRYRGCSDGSCRMCGVPLQSTEVQGAVCATKDSAKGAGCFC